MHTAMNSDKQLIFFVAHLDDYEFSCLSYLFKHHHKYDTIKVIIATHWDYKKDIWLANLEQIEEIIGKKVEYHNLSFSQRTLTKYFDEMKDKFYGIVDFNSNFDIVTHDTNDAHSDHMSVHKASFGIFKYCNRFVTIYSPSSVNFVPNYYIEMSEEEFDAKHKFLTNYDFLKEESYSKKGSYFRKEYTNVASIYAMENFINCDMQYCEIYKIYKWVE